MSSRGSLVLAFVAGLLVAGLLAFAPFRPAPPQTWEYTMGDGPGLSVTATEKERQHARQAAVNMLNTHGQDGWDLVEVVQGTAHPIAIFRRPR